MEGPHPRGAAPPSSVLWSALIVAGTALRSLVVPAGVLVPLLGALRGVADRRRGLLAGRVRPHPLRVGAAGPLLDLVVLKADPPLVVVIAHGSIIPRNKTPA